MEERLLKLEKSNKRMKKYIAFIHIFLISAVFFGFQSISNKFDVVELNKLILRDNNGLERAVLLVDSTDAVKLRFKDTSGVIRTSLGVQADGKGYFSLVNSRDKSIFQVYENDFSGELFFSTADSSNKAIIMGYRATNQDTIGFLNFLGKYRSEFSIGQIKSGGILIANSADTLGKGNVTLGIDGLNSYFLRFHNEDFLGGNYNGYYDASGLTLQNSKFKVYVGRSSDIKGGDTLERSFAASGNYGFGISRTDNRRTLCELGTSYNLLELSSPAPKDSNVTSLSIYNDIDNAYTMLYNSPGNVGFNIYDNNHNLRYYSILMQSKGLLNAMIDENQVVRYYNSIDQSNNVSSSIYDKSGKLRLNLGNTAISQNNLDYTTSESSIYLFDANGHSIFNVPQ